MKVTKTETTCDICGEAVEQNGFHNKEYIALKGKQIKSYIHIMSGGTKVNTELNICYQCLHDLGTLVNRLREEKNKEAKDE
jgi:hypothetical protein